MNANINLRSTGVERHHVGSPDAEEVLRQVERPVWAFIEHFPGYVWLKDVRGRYVYLHRNAARLTRRPKDWQGRTDDDLWPEEMAARYKANDRKVISRREVFVTEEPYRRPDRTVGHMLVSRFPILNKDGTVALLGAISVDTTEHKRVEATLRQTEQYLTAFMEHVPGFAWIKDAQGHYVYLSGARARLPAHPRDWRGKTDDELWPAAVAAEHKASDQVVLATRQVLQTVGRYPREGKRGHMLVSRFPILDATGAVAMVGGVSLDITERMEAEGSLERSREQLRALAARSRIEREEESLRIARDIHDIPGQALTSLHMDILWLEGKMAEEKDPHLRSEVRKRLKSMASLLEATVKSVQQISTDLRPSLLQDLGLTAALEWQAKEFKGRTGIHCRWKRKPVEVQLSPDRATALFRIFQETLTNVARHAHARNVAVSFNQTGNNLVLQVKDDGSGFDEKQISERTSLGLLGMRERALLIGGELKIQSSRGKGTVVTATLPTLPSLPKAVTPSPSRRRRHA